MLGMNAGRNAVSSGVIQHGKALHMVIGAAKGLQSVMRSNLGPNGTLKMLVDANGDTKLTKDGKVLLDEMQITNSAGIMIANGAVTQEAAVGDGTTGVVILTGELAKKTETHLQNGVHPRMIVEGFNIARDELKKFSHEKKITRGGVQHLTQIANSVLSTKLPWELSETIAHSVVEAVMVVWNNTPTIDLHMVEIQSMKHKLSTDTKLIKGLVLDHGKRNPYMPSYLENVHVLTCNISLEYEKSDLNSSFFYKTAIEREEQVNNERSYVEKKVQKIIDLKKKVCKEGEGFLVINQKGIDPRCLELLGRENILALRRAKRRNMERLTLACGGRPINSIDLLSPDVLGWAGKVYEHILGEERYTFIDEVKNPKSCTILLRGPNKETIQRLKDAVRSGLKAVANAISDGFVLKGAGCFEIASHIHLKNFLVKIPSEYKIGVKIFADALLIIPRVLIENAGYDANTLILEMIQQHKEGKETAFDHKTGTTALIEDLKVWDVRKVKVQQLNTASTIMSQLLLIDEIIISGKAQDK